MSAGVILYGPPAAGKDSVGRALAQISVRYQHFERLKVGGGRTSGYRIIAPAALDALRAAGEVVWENHAYGSTYVIDSSGLSSALSSGVPVLHVGQAEAVSAVRQSFPAANWTVVDLWCPREVARERLAARGDAAVLDRLAVWDATSRRSGLADLMIDTSECDPSAAARLIDSVAGSRVLPE